MLCRRSGQATSCLTRYFCTEFPLMADAIELKLATHSNDFPDRVARATEIHIHYRLPAYVMTNSDGQAPYSARTAGDTALTLLLKPLENREVHRSIEAGLCKLLSEAEVMPQRESTAICGSERLRSSGRTDEVSARMAALTPRESEVMELLLTGKTQKQIAAELNISIQTAAKHRSKVLEKLQVANDVELLRLTLALDSPAE
jgi:two-component system response regulator FixJ